MRFAKGEFDLNHDRTFDPECRTFTDLPEEIFEEIASYLSSDERYTMRDVSKNIRGIVDSWKPDIVDMRFEQSMLDDERQKFARFLRNSRLELESLKICHTDNRSAEMVTSVLKQVKHQVRVKDFDTYDQNITEIASVISKLNPKTLKTVRVSINDESVDNMKEFLQLEQIKRLDSLSISTNLESSKFPLKCFYDYPDFNIDFRETDDIKPIIRFARKLIKKDTNFRSCQLYFEDQWNWENLFRKHFSYRGNPGSIIQCVRHISIPETNDGYALDYLWNEISVDRRTMEYLEENFDDTYESMESNHSYDTDDYSDVDSDLSD